MREVGLTTTGASTTSSKNCLCVSPTALCCVLLSGYPCLLTNWDVHHSINELREPVSHDDRDIGVFVNVLHLRRAQVSLSSLNGEDMRGNPALHHHGMRTTPWMNCACGANAVFRTICRSLVHNWSVRHYVCGLLHHLHHWYLPLRHRRDVDDLVDELQLLNLHGSEHCLDHRHLSLHHDCHGHNLVHHSVDESEPESESAATQLFSVRIGLPEVVTVCIWVRKASQLSCARLGVLLHAQGPRQLDVLRMTQAA